MTRKEIVAEIKARGKRPAGLLPAELWTALARAAAAWAMRPHDQPLVHPQPCESLSPTRPVTELLGFDKFPAARAGFIPG
jgi:hypothetical protein